MTEKLDFTAKDFATDQDVRWCPGCGDYSILKQVQTILPEIGLPPEQIAWNFAVETDHEGYAVNISFVGISDSNQAVSLHKVPLIENVPAIIEVSGPEQSPVELPAAPVSLPKLKKDKASDKEGHEE